MSETAANRVIYFAAEAALFVALIDAGEDAFDSLIDRRCSRAHSLIGAIAGPAKKKINAGVMPGFENNPHATKRP